MFLFLLLLLLLKSLHSCPTLCDTIDGSPPGSPVPGIIQARTLEWVAISFSNVWKWKVKVKLLSRIQLLATPWTAVYQAPWSMGFSRQEWGAIAFSKFLFLDGYYLNRRSNIHFFSAFLFFVLHIQSIHPASTKNNIAKLTCTGWRPKVESESESHSVVSNSLGPHAL